MKLRITVGVSMIALVLLAFFAWRASRQATTNAPLETVRATETPASANAPAEIASSEKPVATERTVAEVPVATTPIVPSTNAKLQVLVVAKEDRRPLTNVHVMLRPRARVEGLSWSEVEGSHGTMSTSPKCDKDGRVDFDADTGVALYISANPDDGSAAYRELEVAPLAAGETREVVLELVTTNDFVFFGRVIDRETRAPLAADVRIESMRRKHESKTLHTDADGRFDVSLASWSPSSLVVLADGYAEVDVFAEKVHDSIEHALVIEVSRAATLRVRLTDANGAAIQGAFVSLSTDKYHLTVPRDAALYGMMEMSTWSLRRPTDANGIAELSTLPPDVPLSANATRGKEVLRRELEPIALKPGEVRELTWRVGGGCELKGRVIDQDDKPVVRRTLWLMSPTDKRSAYFREYSGDEARATKTDADGRFSFKDVAPGAWWVGPANDQSTITISNLDVDPLEQLVAPLAQIVEIAEGESVHEVELRVDRGLYIRGHVLDPNDRPVAGVNVTAFQPATRLLRASYEHGSEEFVLGPLKRGTYTLRASAPSGFCTSDPVECSTGASDVILRLKPGGTISGIVIDGETNQPVIAVVTWSRPSKPKSAWGTLQSKPDGSFTSMALETDLYEIAANDSRGRVALAHGVAVTAGAETKGVRLVLEPGAIARVRYDGDEAYGQFTIYADGAVIAGDGIQKGSTRDFRVPRGSVKFAMSLLGAGTQFEKTFDFKVGETKVLEFPKDWH